MSALGQKQTFAPQKAVSALPPIATLITFFGMSVLRQKRHRQKTPRCIEGDIGDPSPKIELNTPFGHPTVYASKMSSEDGGGEQRKCLGEIVRRPPQSAGDSSQPRRGLVPRTCRPDIATLHACSMRGQYNLH